MKKKILSLALIIILGILLCSCSGDSTEKMFGVKLPSGKKLELYMSREKAESIMSNYEYEYDDIFHIYDYGFIRLAYTEGILTSIDFGEDSDVTLLNGLGIGSTDYQKYGFEFQGQYLNTGISYKKVNGKYEQTDTDLRDMEFKDGIIVTIVISKENKEITYITIGDTYSSVLGEFDE